MSDSEQAPTELDDPTSPVVSPDDAAANEPSFNLDDAFPMYTLNSCDGPSVDISPMTMKEKFEEEMGPVMVQLCAQAAREQRASERLNRWGVPIMTAGCSGEDGHSSRKRARIQASVQELPDDLRTEAHSRLDRFLSMPGTMFEPEDAFQYVKKLQQDQVTYYIGITERPAERWEQHAAKGWRKMSVWMHLDSRYSAARERALIARNSASCHQQNISSGGGGASLGEPHFSYIVSKK